MELETKLPISDREARKVIESNFQKIEPLLADIESIKRILKKNGIEDYPE